MSEETIALVTGANKGIGYEIAAGLGTLGWRVGVGARNEERREAAVAKLRAADVDAFGVSLDVTDDASVAAAAGLIEDLTRDPEVRHELSELRQLVVDTLDGVRRLAVQLGPSVLEDLAS